MSEAENEGCGVASIAPILEAERRARLVLACKLTFMLKHTKQIEYRPLNVLGALVQVGQSLNLPKCEMG